jgi:hypothetical protein
VELLVQEYEHFITADTPAVLFSREVVVIKMPPATETKDLCQEKRTKAME